MQAPADAGAIQDLSRPAVEPAAAVDRKRACPTIRKWPGRITAAEPPYPGTAVGKSDSAAPLLAMGSASKGLGAAGRRQNHSRDTMLPHNAGMEPASGIACKRLRRQSRSQNARKGQTGVHLYYISFKRKPATLEPNTSFRQRENPSRLFREASATAPPRTIGCQAFLFKTAHFVAAAFDRTADTPRRDLGRHGSATTLCAAQKVVLQIYNPKIDSLTE